jgi:hypothetical protein
MTSGNSYITVNDVFLLFKPVEYNLFVILFALLIFVLLVYCYRMHKDKIHKFNFIVLGALIVINSVYLPVFMQRMFLENQRFTGLSQAEAMQKLLPENIFRFYQLLDKTIKPGETFYFAEPWDSAYENVMTKFQLSYYLAPRKIAAGPEESNYIIIVNMSNKPRINIEIPHDRIRDMEKISDQLILLKLEDPEK